MFLTPVELDVSAYAHTYPRFEMSGYIGEKSPKYHVLEGGATRNVASKSCRSNFSFVHFFADLLVIFLIFH